MLDLAIEAVSAASADAIALIAELDDELRRRYETEEVHGLSPRDVEDPETTFLIGRIAGEAVACGAVRRLNTTTGEVKRMFVRPAYRGQGFSRLILVALERDASRRGIKTLRLETGTLQPEAIALYQSAGHTGIPLYGEFVGNLRSRCFEKVLR